MVLFSARETGMGSDHIERGRHEASPSPDSGRRNKRHRQCKTKVQAWSGPSLLLMIEAGKTKHCHLLSSQFKQVLSAREEWMLNLYEEEEVEIILLARWLRPICGAGILWDISVQSGSCHSKLRSSHPQYCWQNDPLLRWDNEKRL